MKGIILAGGKGTRLYPLTHATSKQLLPVYNKPMIYYPLSVLMLAGIQDILIITFPETQAAFRNVLGDGSQWGINLSYATQAEARGHVDALLIGADFIAGQSVCLIFGDNIIYGHGVSGKVHSAAQISQGALVFAYPVSDPERFGVVEFDNAGKVLSIEEKPEHPRSNFVIPGIYFYDREVVHLARQVKPSPRSGELEITALNRLYLEQHALHVEVLGRGVAWLDAGTHESLLEASNFVRAVEHRQGLMIACLEEIAFRRGFVSKDAVLKSAEAYHPTNEYGQYLRRLLDEEDIE